MSCNSLKAHTPRAKHKHSHAFTLIELSIVLVIIGLIAGSILLGRDLIRVAEVNAQISQIQSYQAAVNTFRVKYGYLPGDIPDPIATDSGLIPRGTGNGYMWGGSGYMYGCGNGDELLTCGYNYGAYYGGIDSSCQAGETTVFWVDLSTAGLITPSFTLANFTERIDGYVGSSGTAVITNASNPSLSAFLPKAKIGNGNYVYVWSGGIGNHSNPDTNNYLTVSAVSTINADGTDAIVSNPGIMVAQAYAIDNKMDDGLPQSGAVQAFYLPGEAGGGNWVAGGGLDGASTGYSTSPGFGPTTKATPYLTTNCYDNNGIIGPQQYSMKNADIANCALSFRFQ